MADDLANDRIKLIAYNIVFAKPGRETIMPGGQGSFVIAESISEEQLVAFIIARYFRPEVDPPPALDDVFTVADDRKYLKVQYVVVADWPKEPLNAEGRQARALETLRDRSTTGKGTPW